MSKVFLIIAALAGFCAVSLGAFGAHALKTLLSADMLTVYQTAVQYHFYHVLALLTVGLLAQRFPDSKSFKWSGCLLVIGLIIFSGSLYVLSITGLRWLGMITPIGGMAFLAAWLLMALGLYRHC